jgi:hypothetical protein
LPRLKPGAPPYKGLPATANLRSVKQVKKMVGRGNPDRGSSIGGLKANTDSRDGALYNTIKLLLYDERGFRHLCDIDDEGIYRDGLEMKLRQWIRPLSRKDAQDYITNLVALGVFNTVIVTIEKPIPVDQLRKRGGKKKQPPAEVLEAIEKVEPEFRALIPEDIKIPRGYQFVGFVRTGFTVSAIVRFWKVKLIPSGMLREVCCEKFYVCVTS